MGQLAVGFNFKPHIQCNPLDSAQRHHYIRPHCMCPHCGVPCPMHVTNVSVGWQAGPGPEGGCWVRQRCNTLLQAAGTRP